MKQPSLLATRRSLVEHLADWGDQLRWQEFFDTYWKLIYSAARRSGLTDAEAQEVVQETIITVAKNIDKLKYDPAIGSFKGWLLQITRWRIADQFRKREPGNPKRPRSSDDRATATIERVPDSRGIDLDAVWETEWKENLFEAAITRVKKQIEPKQFQIFDCYVRKEWPAQKVAARLGVNIGQVYLARHRVGAFLRSKSKRLKRAVADLEATPAPAAHQNCFASAACVKSAIPDEVTAQTPIIPDHELLRVIGRGAYGEIWLARTVTGAFRAVKVVYRSTFESERTFLREFEGMSAFEPISRAHAGFINILHVGRTAEYLYYSMELADDHLDGRKIDIGSYEPRTLKTDLARHKRLSADDSIRLGLSLTEALEALHERGLTHRDIKPSNIIFMEDVPKLADIGLVAASGQRSFVGTEGYVPPEGPGTPRADIYSLGKLLYETCTGKDRLDFPEFDSQLSTRPDRERLLQLNDVLVKACANDPNKRYGSAAEMHRDLTALKQGERPRKSRAKILVVTVSLIVLLVAAIGFWLSPSQPPDVHLQTTIRTEPAGALVVLGDRAQKSPATFADLEARKYNLRIMSPGYEPVETSVDFKRKQLPDLPPFRLVRSKGTLEILSEPPGAQFSLRSEDGQVSREGVTPANRS